MYFLCRTWETLDPHMTHRNRPLVLPWLVGSMVRVQNNIPNCNNDKHRLQFCYITLCVKEKEGKIFGGGFTPTV